MKQHSYRQQTLPNVEEALRLIEQREGEGWELVGLFPKPIGLGAVGRDFEVVVITRLAQSPTPAAPPGRAQ